MADLIARLDTLEIAINQLAGLLLKPMQELVIEPEAEPVVD